VLSKGAVEQDVGGVRTKGSAQMAAGRGDVLEAESLWRSLAEQEERNDQTMNARLELSQLAADRGAWGESRAWWERLDPSLLSLDTQRRYRVLDARLLDVAARHGLAAIRWLEVAGDSSSHALKKDAWRAAARAFLMDGSVEDAEKTVRHFNTKNPGKALLAIVDTSMSPTGLEHLFDSLESTDPWGAWIDLRVARNRCASGDLQGCREAAIRTLGRSGVDAVTRLEAQALMDMTVAWNDVRGKTIGVLLPLSGPYQRLGQSALQSIRLALQNHPEVRLVIRDTRGEKEEAAKQARALIVEEHVMAILGPIGRHESARSLSVTREYGVPHMLLSADHDATGSTANGLRLRLSRVEQSSMMARYAFATLGVRKFAIVYPETSSGRKMMTAFWDEVVTLGGEIVAAQGFSPADRDFNDVAKSLLDAQKPGRGVVDFQALFIPAHAIIVRRLLPFLKYWGLRIKTSPKMSSSSSRTVVQLLGNSEWNHGQVIEQGEQLTDNAIFVDAFFADPEDPVAAEFVERFQASYRERPTSVHAEIYDAADILAEVVYRVSEETDAPSIDAVNPLTHAAREDLLKALKSIEGYRGVTGHISLLSSGVAQKDPNLLTIDLEEIRPRRSEQEEIEIRRHGVQEGPR